MNRHGPVDLEIVDHHIRQYEYITGNDNTAIQKSYDLRAYYKRMASELKLHRREDRQLVAMMAATIMGGIFAADPATGQSSAISAWSSAAVNIARNMLAVIDEVP